MGAQAEDANGETLPFPLTLIDQAQGTVATSAVCPACQQWLEPCSHQLQAPAQPRNGRACIRHRSAPGLPGHGSLPSGPPLPAHPKTPSLFPFPLTHTHLLPSLSLSVYWGLLGPSSENRLSFTPRPLQRQASQVGSNQENVNHSECFR